jgi:GT2 family glycosyltransferase
LEKSPPRVLISICTRGTIPWEFQATFGALIKPKGCSVSYEPKVFMIDAARNAEVEKFLKAKEFTHQLFLDDDLVLLKPDLLMRLLSRNLPIVSGLYFRADFPHYPIILKEYDINDANETLMHEYVYAEKPYPRDTLLTCDAVGAGLLLVRRDVYEKLKPPYFEWDTKRQIGEDIWFCRKVREAGFQLRVDTGAVALHCVRAPAGPPELLWEWYRQRFPLNQKKLAMIKKALETISPEMKHATGGVLR